MAARKTVAVAGRVFERILVGAFRKAGWQVRRPLHDMDTGADLLLDANGKRYAVALKVSSEGRRDRLIPLLSQAILQAQEFARKGSTVPIAVVAAKYVPLSAAEQVTQFAARYAPEVGVGVIDSEGLRKFAGPGLDALEALPPRHSVGRLPSPQRPSDLFSGLNQWMLKILLGQRLPETVISVPRVEIRNASQLARAARVSVMSASRFVRHLADQGFLDESQPRLRRDRLQIVRVDELLELWASASRQVSKEISGRWIVKAEPHQLRSTLREYASWRETWQAARRGQRREAPPRCCLGLFAAAEALGLGFVHGVPSHMYLERLTPDSLHRLGLSIDPSGRPADVYIRIPVHSETVFSASVLSGGAPSADVLQVWLDVSTHPARGSEQAREIQRRVLKPLFGKQR